MSRIDRIALFLSLLAVMVTYAIHVRVFEGMAHLEDEMAYVWQAQVIAKGQLTVSSPPSPKSFLFPFVVDYHGQRFGKYPLGWPAVLALGERLGNRGLVNPLLAGFGVWLTYLLAKKLFGETVAILAAGLTLTSPFFLMNSASLLSHPLGLVLSAAFVLGWVDAFCTRSISPRSGSLPSRQERRWGFLPFPGHSRLWRLVCLLCSMGCTFSSVPIGTRAGFSCCLA